MKKFKKVFIIIKVFTGMFTVGTQGTDPDGTVYRAHFRGVVSSEGIIESWKELFEGLREYWKN